MTLFIVEIGMAKKTTTANSSSPGGARADFCFLIPYRYEWSYAPHSHQVVGRVAERKKRRLIERERGPQSISNVWSMYDNAVQTD